MKEILPLDTKDCGAAGVNILSNLWQYQCYYHVLICFKENVNHLEIFTFSEHHKGVCSIELPEFR